MSFVSRILEIEAFDIYMLERIFLKELVQQTYMLPLVAGLVWDNGSRNGASIPIRSIILALPDVFTVVVLS